MTMHTSYMHRESNHRGLEIGPDFSLHAHSIRTGCAIQIKYTTCSKDDSVGSASCLENAAHLCAQNLSHEDQTRGSSGVVDGS